MKIIINPGHWNTIAGRRDKGAQGIVVDGTRVMERERTGVVARLLAAMLPVLGVEVELYPYPDDSFLPDLNNIGRYARSQHADLLISIHCDASGQSGASAYYDQEKSGSQQLGAALATNVAMAMGIPNLGSIVQYKTATCNNDPTCTLAIHRESRALGSQPAVLSILVECGYVDNPVDATVLARHPELAAQGIFNGVKQYFSLSGGIAAPDPDYAIYAAPTINLSLFAEVLRDKGSPAYDEVEDCYQVSTDNGVNPAVALAFFALESNYGNAPGAAELHNWGNLTDPNSGQLRSYESWALGLRDWCNHFRLPPYSTHNLITISQVVPIYRPSSSGGNVEGYNRYIMQLHDLIKGWYDELVARGQTFFPR